MQLSQLEYVVEIIRCGSMNKAAEKLFVSQPNLSKSIKNLEDELGIVIFERNHQGIKLTRQGKKIYYYAMAIMKESESILDIAQQQKTHCNTLYLATVHMVATAQILGKYYGQACGENVHLELLEYNLQEVLKKVQHYDVELGIVSYCSILKKQFAQTLRMKKLEFHGIYEAQPMIVVGKENPYYGKKQISAAEMIPFPIIKTTDDDYTITQSGKVFDNVGFSSFNKVITMNSIGMAAEFISQTDAIKIIGSWNKSCYEQMGLWVLPISNINAVLTLGYVQRKNEQLSDEAEQFIKLLLESKVGFECRLMSGKEQD